MNKRVSDSFICLYACCLVGFSLAISDIRRLKVNFNTVYFIIFYFIYRKERNTYYRHRDKARKNPNLYASIIIDGMDQNKTNLPHYSRHMKVRIFSSDMQNQNQNIFCIGMLSILFKYFTSLDIYTFF